MCVIDDYDVGCVVVIFCLEGVECVIEFDFGCDVGIVIG